MVKDRGLLQKFENIVCQKWSWQLYSVKPLTKLLHKKEISGSVLPDPENRVQVGPDLHLVGTPNIFIIFSPEKASVTSVI